MKADQVVPKRVKSRLNCIFLCIFCIQKFYNKISEAFSSWTHSININFWPLLRFTLIFCSVYFAEKNSTADGAISLIVYHPVTFYFFPLRKSKFFVRKKLRASRQNSRTGWGSVICILDSYTGRYIIPLYIAVCWTCVGSYTRKVHVSVGI